MFTFWKFSNIFNYFLLLPLPSNSNFLLDLLNLWKLVYIYELLCYLINKHYLDLNFIN